MTRLRYLSTPSHIQRILVINDNTRDGRLLRDVLELEGYSVEEAYELGKQAFSKLLFYD